MREGGRLALSYLLTTQMCRFHTTTEIGWKVGFFCQIGNHIDVAVLLKRLFIETARNVEKIGFVRENVTELAVRH